ncbi:hypothetical protein KIH79_05340 [Bifidobacterium sp. 82T10]|uniref:SAF domain-containing protein n=2 Tax=Bifidobacterium miconis TaxID=2834435 RepID=A0ABS6WEB9_9BIFI|nr:hypothetical protein [Bifidobacterium miconis]
MDSLRRRRSLRIVRRWLSALCAGLAVFAALSCVAETMETQPILVAIDGIERGAIIDGRQLRIVDAPASSAFDAAIGSLEELNVAAGGAHGAVYGGGGIAQVDIAAGQPLFRSMVGARPVVPDGHAVVEVRLSSAPDALTVGDEVTLASTTGCSDSADLAANDHTTDGGETDGTTDRPGAPSDTPPDTTSSGTNDTTGAARSADAEGLSSATESVSSCTLAPRAAVMALPHTAATGGSVFRSDESALVSLAMPSEDAIRVLAAQESGPVIAVAR